MFADVVICRSKVLQADVLFVRDENTPVPRDLATLPVYTWAELLELLRIEMTPQELPAIHKLKVQFGGRIGESSLRPIDTKTGCPACGSAALTEGKCGWCGHTVSPPLQPPPSPPRTSAPAQGELFG